MYASIFLLHPSPIPEHTPPDSLSRHSQMPLLQNVSENPNTGERGRSSDSITSQKVDKNIPARQQGTPTPIQPSLELVASISYGKQNTHKIMFTRNFQTKFLSRNFRSNQTTSKRPMSDDEIVSLWVGLPQRDRYNIS